MAKFSLSNSLKVRNQLEKEQYQEILSLYQNMAKKARSQARKLRGGTQSDKLQASELRKLAKQLQQEAEAIGKRLEKEIPDTLLKASQAVVEDLDKFNQKIGLTIEGAYRRVPTDIVEVLVSGKLYGDDWSLSKAIWADIKKTQKDINTVVAEGLALNKSSYDIAKDLEKYVDPTAKKPWDWSKVYPGTKKKVDYNAQRLARTMVGHAYQQSVVATTENNPFIDGILWISGHTRTTCEICEKRNGKVFPADKLPLDHPNGKCSFAPQVDRSMDDIADELADWAKGKSNKDMDEWFSGMYPKIPKELSIGGVKETKSNEIELISGKGNPELTDSIDDFSLPKKVRKNLNEYHKLRTYEQIKEFLGARGILLDTDLAALKEKRNNDEITSVMELGQKIAVAIDSYREVFGSDALSKLKKVVLYSDDEDATASYRYNALGEDDPTAGSIHFRDWSSGGREVFHELAHAFQDSHAKSGEDAVSYSNRMVIEAKLGEDSKTYSGVGEDVMQAERFADAFASAFVYGRDESIGFLIRVAELENSKHKT